MGRFCRSIGLREALISLPVLAVMPVAAGQAQDAASLCAPGEKTWFAGRNDGGAIAVCSEPAGSDRAGTIRVRRQAAGSSRPEVVAEASGDKRQEVFTIRRYTRPQTTYLKFEFSDGSGRTVLYIDFDYGETSVRMKDDGHGSEPVETELEANGEPLELMGLEGIVATEPYDE